jgi:acetyltransferase (GNAT) family protein
VIELFRRIVPELGTTVWLRDGRRVLVRPLGREDAPRLVELHRRLSPRTRYLRFMSAKPVLGIDEAEHLAHVDFRERFAVAAVRRDGDHEEVVAVARFHLLENGKAEAAIVVHQGVGLGTRLLGHLLSLARWAGVTEFSGEVLASNTRMLQLLKLGGASVSRARAGGVEFSIPVRSASLPFRMLRAFASEAARFATLGRSAG